MPDFLHGGNELADFFGDDDFGFRGRTEGDAAFDGFLDGGDDLVVVVAEDHRTPGADVVDVGLAFGVPHVGALGAFNEARGAAHGTEGSDGRVDAAGNDLLSAVEEFLIVIHRCAPKA